MYLRFVKLIDGLPVYARGRAERWRQELRRLRRRSVAPAARVAIALSATLMLASCGGSSSTPQATLRAFLADWSRQNWPAMKRLVADPPADFAATNAAAFTGLGVRTAGFGPGRVVKSGSRATVRVVERFALPQVGAWSPSTTVRLVQRSGRWLVAWSPATINPSLRAGDRLSATRSWPARAPILGASGAPLTADRPLVTVGVVGSRIKRAGVVKADLIAAGATQTEVATAFAQAKAHPDYFDPVFQLSKARFEQLKVQPGSTNVYAVPGTQFELASARSAITPQLAAHLVGSVGPITADQLHQLGVPYDAGSVVGRNGLEQAYERRLAGAPRTQVAVINGRGIAVATLATYPGRRGATVVTSIDPRVQRAAESALAGERRNAALIALRASTGQVLAVVSDPAGYAYDQALQGAYPPGSTFKVLTSTALIRAGLSPASPASCPPSITIDGEVFHNAEGDQAVQTLEQGFVESCNTAFIALATAHLKRNDFSAVAGLYGLDRTPEPGLPAFDAEIPTPDSQTSLAATAIGQAAVTFSPLGMATVAGAVASGTVRAPRLVQGAPDDTIAASPLPSDVTTDLREMMAQVVASGTAAGTGLPSATRAKTGTAQYSSGGVLRTDAWLMGYDGDIAFAVVVQNSGGVNGGPLDGPIIARFLDALGSGA
jgi:cell division protein FtsI/penicillin-binding protein 2